VIVDEGNHGLNRRSSSAWAKYALAFAQDLVGLPEARGVLAFPEPSALSPHPWEHRGRAHHRRARPFFTHSCSVCAVQPIWAAIDETAAQREACSPS